MEKTKINITDEVAIHISDMNKWFGNFHVLRDINLEVRRGERIAVSYTHLTLPTKRIV